MEGEGLWHRKRWHVPPRSPWSPWFQNQGARCRCGSMTPAIHWRRDIPSLQLCATAEHSAFGSWIRAAQADVVGRWRNVSCQLPLLSVQGEFGNPTSASRDLPFLQPMETSLAVPKMGFSPSEFDVLATVTSQLTMARSRARDLTSNLRQWQTGADTTALITSDDSDEKGQSSNGQAAKVTVEYIQDIVASDSWRLLEDATTTERHLPSWPRLCPHQQERCGLQKLKHQWWRAKRKEHTRSRVSAKYLGSDCRAQTTRIAPTSLNTALSHPFLRRLLKLSSFDLLRWRGATTATHIIAVSSGPGASEFTT